MAYGAEAIANAILDLAQARGISDMTPMKLQKLIYFAHGWHLGVKSEPLILEQVEAWKYGPVVPSIYEATRKYGNQPLSAHRVTVVDEDDAGDICEKTPSLDQQERQEVAPLLEWILDQYGDKSGIALSNMTHETGAPWHQVFVKYEGQIPRATDIEPSRIQEHFSQKAQELV